MWFIFQVLASLRSVRSNFTILANVSTPTVKLVSLKCPQGWCDVLERGALRRLPRDSCPLLAGS